MNDGPVNKRQLKWGDAYDCVKQGKVLVNATGQSHIPQSKLRLRFGMAFTRTALL